MANNRASDKSRAGGRMGHWVISKKSSFIEPNIHYVNFDKVTLTIQKAYTILFSNEDELSRFSISLKQAQKDCLFSRSHKNQFTFSKNFLFSGKLFLIRDFHEQKRYGALPIKIKLQLYLNPTRAVRHASYTSNLKHFNYKNYLNSLAPLTVLEKEPLVNHSSLGLDGEDNVIDKVDVFFNERPAKNVFNLYLNKVLEIIDTALVETASQMSFECNLQEAMEDWTVDHAECYWEYISSDALSVVRWLQNYLPHLFGKAHVATYIYNDSKDIHATKNRKSQRKPTIGRKINCPTITLGLGNEKIDLVIYAKLIDRIRFEIRYKGNLKQILRAENDTLEKGLNELIDKAVIRAHGYLKRTFKHIRTDDDPAAQMNLPTLISFLGAIASIANTISPAIFRKIFSVLLNTGGIVVDKESAEHEACHQLETQGILHLSKIVRPKPKTIRYTLPPQQKKALEAMFSALTHRPRKRSKKE